MAKAGFEGMGDFGMAYQNVKGNFEEPKTTSQSINSPS